MMYLEFFGLQAKPFHTTPDPYFLYLSSSHKQALGSIIYGVKEKKGFIAVTGEVGLGKTTILRSFLAQGDQASQRIIYLFNPNLSFASVLKKLLRELGHDPIEGGDAEVVDQLHMVLIDEYYKSKTVVLLIDDAQNMPVATLENLRMLSNLETSEDKLIQIVLLGQPELDSLLDRYELRQIRQRIALRATIRPLSLKESHQYIRHRLNKAGGEGKAIFTKGALKRIIRAANGIPRRLNILCDNALVTALGYQKNPVTDRIAKEVVNDLTGKSSHALWKLIPLAAGVLILVLGLIALLPFTHSNFPQTPSFQKIGYLFDQGVDQVGDGVIVSKDTNVADKADVLFSEAITSVSDEEVELLVVDPVDSFPVRQNSETFKEPSLQLAKNVRENVEELPPLDVNQQSISDNNDVIAVDAQGQNQHTDTRMEGVVEELEELSNLELAPLLKSVSNELISLNAKGINQATDSTMEDVAEESEELFNMEIMPRVNSVKDEMMAVNSEGLNQPKDTKVRNVLGKSEESSKLDIAPGGKPKKDGVPSLDVSTKKEHKFSTSSPITKTMKKGDTLASLMHEVYGSASPTRLRLVLSHNRHIVNVRKIFPGQEILFPPLTMVDDKKKPTDNARVLISHTGEELRSSNKIFTESSPRIRPNQKKVKTKRTKPYAVAIVQEGDTLEKLAKIVYGSSDPLYVQRVLDFNPIIQNPKNIFPGQNIVFPRVKEAKDLAGQSSQVLSRE